MEFAETIGAIIQVVVGLIFLGAGLSVFWNWLAKSTKKAAAHKKLIYGIAGIAFAAIGAWLAYGAVMALLSG